MLPDPCLGPVEKPQDRHLEIAEGGRGDLGSTMKIKIATSPAMARSSQ